MYIREDGENEMCDCECGISFPILTDEDLLGECMECRLIKKPKTVKWISGSPDCATINIEHFSKG